MELPYILKLILHSPIIYDLIYLSQIDYLEVNKFYKNEYGIYYIKDVNYVTNIEINELYYHSTDENSRSIHLELKKGFEIIDSNLFTPYFPKESCFYKSKNKLGIYSISAIYNVKNKFIFLKLSKQKNKLYLNIDVNFNQTIVEPSKHETIEGTIVTYESNSFEYNTKGTICINSKIWLIKPILKDKYLPYLTNHELIIINSTDNLNFLFSKQNNYKKNSFYKFTNVKKIGENIYVLSDD
jgi:hypothetical protein